MTFIVTALQSEARPLVRHFGLKGSDAPSPYRIYYGEEITLVVSGVGRVASAAATSFVFARAGAPRNRPWINVGIAGHPSAEIGSAWLAHKISDDSTGRSWYPSLVFDPGVPTAEVVTVDQPENRFARHALYDMEASAFFAVASRFALVELVQVLKIVSDNPSAPAGGLKPADVARLVGEHAEAVSELVTKTRTVADGLAEVPVDPEPWMSGRHFTVSQTRKLFELLRRLTVLDDGTGFSADDFSGAGDARGLLLALERRVTRGGVAF
ncbi:MAG: 5'-methylthioadenosine/S-adenosylhomocysteine nucleosidase [bacterium]|nr:5'-methylthioadenosine/S-adenosylhomocysteine nucleosidase [bacterium]